jgi:predicted dehydrogenase
MRAAIVGTGGIAQVHAAALRELGHTITLVMGHSSASAELFSKAVDCDRFSDQLNAELLADVDCVHICVPPENHAEFIRTCLQAGKHVMCEKPLSLSAREAAELTQLAEQSGVVAAVNFNNRFYPACNRVRSAAAAMNRIVLVQGHYRQEFHILPTQYSWRYQEELRATTEIGSHFIDLMRYLTGLEVESVSAAFLNATPERRVRDGMMYPNGDGEPLTITSEDAAAVTFRLSGGALASAVFSEISPGRSNDLTIEISSPDKSVSWCSESPYEIVTGEPGGGLTHRRDAFGGGFSDTFRDSFQAFYQTAESGIRDPRLATFRDGAANAAICAAIAKSARSGGESVEVEPC